MDCRAGRAMMTVLAGLLISPGCEISRGPTTLRSDDPLVEMPAIKRASDQNRAQDVPPLVELLEDTDPAVRMFAIGSLVKLTGTDLDYHYYEPELKRQPAVNAWRARAGLPPRTSATRPASLPASRAALSEAP